MELKLPWTIQSESYLNSPAFSLVEAGGLRVAVGLTRGDAILIAKLVNGTAEPLTLETVFPYFEQNGYSDLLALPEREITEAVYDYFLNILPPIYRPGGFCVSEAISGNVYSFYSKVGERFFHRYVALS